MEPTNSRIGPLQIGIILLTTATALMHFVLIFPDVLFILNAVGYMALLAALYLPIAPLARFRPIIRWLLIGYTALTLAIWLAIGQRDLYAYIDKTIEVVLIVLLWLESRQSRP
jgi:hypothetical protein